MDSAEAIPVLGAALLGVALSAPGQMSVNGIWTAAVMRARAICPPPQEAMTSCSEKFELAEDSDLCSPLAVYGAFSVGNVFQPSLVRSEVNSELNFPPNFEGLVLGCIDADFCK